MLLFIDFFFIQVLQALFSLYNKKVVKIIFFLLLFILIIEIIKKGIYLYLQLMPTHIYRPHNIINIF